MDSEHDSELREIIKAEDKLKEERDFKKARDMYTNWLHKYSPKNKSTFGWEEDLNKSEFPEDLKSNIALAFNNRGHLKYLEVDFTGAVEDYDTALKIDPILSCSYYNRGTIYYRMGYFDKALEDLKKAIKLSPENKEFQAGLEQCRNEVIKPNS